METILCQNCGTTVPSANFQLHQLRCPSVQVAPPSSTAAAVPTLPSPPPTPPPPASDAMDEEELPPDVPVNHSEFALEEEQAGARAGDAARAVAIDAAAETTETTETWTCEACTFANKESYLQCEMCSTVRSDVNPHPAADTDGVTPADAMIQNALNGGALGALIGGGGALLAGRDGTRATNAAVNGALAGAAIGAFFGDTGEATARSRLGGSFGTGSSLSSESSSGSSSSGDSSDGSRGGRGGGTASYSYTTSTITNNGANRTTTTRSYGNGPAITRTILHDEGGSIYDDDGFGDADDAMPPMPPLLAFLQAMQQGQGNAPGVPQLRFLPPEGSMDRLREAMEQSMQDGNTPAPLDAQVNASLPVRTVAAGEKLENCPICLETPTEGEKVKVLPCFHTFHESCVTQWLQHSSKCPICNHVVGE